MSFRMTAVNATLKGFPLRVSLIGKFAEDGHRADRGESGHVKAVRIWPRPPEMSVSFALLPAVAI